MAPPLLSVVIATLDGMPFVRTQLDALAAQQAAIPFEVVIADNGSTDGTVAFALGYGDRLDIQVVDASRRRSRSFARNAGAEAARAEKLVFIDQDDQVCAGYVAAMSRALDTHRFVAARMQADALNPPWAAAARALPQTRSLPDGAVPWAYGCSLGLRSDAFDGVGGFDVAIRWAAEDIDLCWRLHAAGERLVFVPDAVLQYRFPASELAFLRQGHRYGLGHAEVTAKHGIAPPAGGLCVRSWFRGLIGSFRLVVAGRSRGRRASGLFLIGRRVGEAQGAVRYGSVRW